MEYRKSRLKNVQGTCMNDKEESEYEEILGIL